MKSRFPLSRLKKRNDGSETLERLKRWPSLAKKFDQKFVHIVSDEWGAFWGPNGRGYTDDKQKAGLYSFDEAFSRTKHCGSEKRIRYLVALPEYMI